MSVRQSSGVREKRIVEEFEQKVFLISCDACDCAAFLELSCEGGEVCEAEGYGSEAFDDGDSWLCSSEQDAIDIAVEECGWQLGDRGIQYGHVYCPKHREDL